MMTYKTHSIKSVGELLKFLKKNTNTKEPMWFRGQSDASWKLLPGYQRLKAPPPKSVLIKRFKQNANLLVSNVGAQTIDWLFYLQHYGVPTRLLDWSESPLFGIYFAVMSNPKKDGALWALNPLELNSLVSSDPKESKFLPSFEDPLLENYSPESVEAGSVKGVLPMAAIATRNNPRIQAQLGVFTIAHLTKQPIEDIGTGSHIVKYTISAQAKSDFRAELKLLGISKFQLFPELSSAGEIIKELL
jgi:FRG domain